MPTPYTEGNGCAYCRVTETLVGSYDPSIAAKVKKTLQCTCQGPELEECPYSGLQIAMYCEHFKLESEEFTIYLNQLREKILNNASEIVKSGFHDDDPIANVEMVEKTDNGVKVTAKLTKEGKRIMGEEGIDLAKKFNEKVSKLCGCDDAVNHLLHYTAGGIECIDAIKAALECHEDPVGAWLTGQCIKYLWRWPLKNGLEDLKKCRFYLDRLIESFEDED